MFMSVVERTTEFEVYPELAGARVLITGLTSEAGFEVARVFAEHRSRLVVISNDSSPAMTEVAALLGEAAAELRLYNEGSYAPEDLVRLVQRVAGEVGGFDVVINLSHLDEGCSQAVDNGSDLEGVVAEKLEAALRVTQIAANRMRLVWSNGLILNVVTMSKGATGRALLLGDVVQGMLGQLTRGLAQEWAGEGIRINALAPRSSVAALLTPGSDASEVEIAAMALRLASKKSRGLSGHVIDAAEACC